MRLRAQSASGDYTFGQSGANFLVNSRPMVAQSARTRLLLWEGEWFLDIRDGTPYMTSVLGHGTKALYDLAIQTRVLDTPGVTRIAAYSSVLDGIHRSLAVTMTLDTLFGAVPVTVVL